tara:strand:- start:569 stop:805 length:237 start_codon:yes stop_codon:yes gene_type:complete
MSLNILTQKEFEQGVREIYRDKQPITMLDSILLFCEQKGIEVETAASLIPSKMKSLLETEAIKSRLIINKNKAKLPIK